MTIPVPSILLFQPQNQHFPGPVFYCSSHKINIFRAHHFIVAPQKLTIPGPCYAYVLFITFSSPFHLYISLFHDSCLDYALPHRLLMFFIYFI